LEEKIRDEELQLLDIKDFTAGDLVAIALVWPVVIFVFLYWASSE